MSDPTPTIDDPPNAVHILQPTTNEDEHWFVGDNIISDGIITTPANSRSQGWNIEITPSETEDGKYCIDTCLYFIIVDPAWVFNTKKFGDSDNKHQTVCISDFQNGAEDLNIKTKLYNDGPEDTSYQNRVLKVKVKSSSFTIDGPDELPSFSMRFNARFNGVNYESPDPTMIIRDPR